LNLLAAQPDFLQARVTETDIQASSFALSRQSTLRNWRRGEAATSNSRCETGTSQSFTNSFSRMRLGRGVGRSKVAPSLNSKYSKGRKAAEAARSAILQ